MTEAHLNRGKARRAKGNLDGAIADYEKAIELDARMTLNNRDITQAYTNRGFIRANQFDLEGAISDFDKAIRFRRAMRIPTSSAPKHGSSKAICKTPSWILIKELR